MSEKALDVYKSELIRWNKAINLVSPKTIAEVETRHIKDSEQLAQYIPQDVTLMDWGSGGGLPAMVIALLRPDLSVHMVESDSKKSEFLRHVSRETNCKTYVHNMRIDDVDYATIRVDMITARALANLDKLLGWMKIVTMVNPHVEAVFLKGEQWQNEINEALLNHQFEYDIYPSITDKKARIIHIKNLT